MLISFGSYSTKVDFINSNKKDFLYGRISSGNY